MVASQPCGKAKICVEEPDGDMAAAITVALRRLRNEEVVRAIHNEALIH